MVYLQYNKHETNCLAPETYIFIKKIFPLLAFLVNLIMKIAELENSKNRLLLLGWSESLKQKKKSKFYFLNYMQKNTSDESIAGEVSFKWSHHRH